MIHAPIAVLVHMKNVVSAFNITQLPVQTMVIQFNTNMNISIVIIMDQTDSGEPVRHEKLFINHHSYIGYYCGVELANMIIHSQNGCRRHNPEVNHFKKDSCYFNAVFIIFKL